MKKIVVLATYVGINNRGAETFVIELIKRLTEKYKIEVYSLGYSEELRNHLIQVSSPLPFWLKVHSFLFNKISFYKKLCYFLYYPIPDILFQDIFTKKVHRSYLRNRNDIDLFFPTNGISGAKLGSFLKLKRNVPFICTGHGGIGPGEKKILQQKPNIYIALTEENRRWADTYGENVIKIYNGVDTTYFSPINNKEVSKEKIVLCVAALTAFKRQKLLIDAVERLQDTKLLLVGTGEMKDEIETYGVSKLGSRFSISSVPYNEIKQHYSLCSVFSLPSLNEPFGIVYLEALAMNKPIVVPDDSSRREIIGDAGIYCDVENAEKYAEALRLAISKNWGNIPRNRATNIFDWTIISDEYSQIIDETIKMNEIKLSKNN